MLKYLKKYALYCLLAPLFMLGEIAMDLLQPDLMAKIVDEGVLAGNLSVVFATGIRMLLLVAFGGTCGVLCGVFANIAAQRMGNDVRKDLFGHIMSFSFDETDHFTTGSLVTRITNDVTQIEQMVMMSVRSLVRCTVMFLGGIYMLYRQSAEFALVVAVALPFVVILVVIILKKATPVYTIIQSKLDRLNSVMQENIQGARVVKAYVREEYELEHFSKANDELCEANLRAQTILAFLNPIMNIIMNLCVVAVLYVGGYEVKAGGGVTPGAVMAAITYLSLILTRIVFMANIFQTFTRASASWKRIKQVLNTKSSQEDGGKRPKDDVKGTVEFKDVSFAYKEMPNLPVLKHVSFKANKGETVAIIGATGSGKSTLISLIPRFYDAVEGEVLVDGLNVKDFNLKELRERVGIVQQKAELFTGSVGENIAWGADEANEEDIKKAASIAQADEFISSLKGDYNASVTERGHSLSGGQKQRISVARAVIRKPEILIFDDAVSALDLKTEAALHEALNKEFKDTTKIIVAQRTASVRGADRILVIDKGEVVSEGTHEELLASSLIYREICSSQLKEGELA